MDIIITPNKKSASFLSPRCKAMVEFQKPRDRYAYTFTNHELNHTDFGIKLPLEVL